MTARPWQNLFLDMQYQTSTYEIYTFNNYIARSPSQDKPALLADSLLFTTKVFRISSYNIYQKQSRQTEICNEKKAIKLSRKFQF